MTMHRLTPEYTARVEGFAVTFPFAHEFLKRLEVDGPPAGLWLSTAVNAHLYKGDAFIAYLKIKNPELRPPSLVLSRHFHLWIVAGTRDESQRLFSRVLNDVVTAHSAKTGTWWAKGDAGESIELGTETPRAFFTSLYDRLTDL